MKFSNSEENYIKAVYHLQQNSANVTTNELAAELKTKPASVTDMLKKLKAKKLINYEKYKGFSLSANGNKLALSIVRKHRLWEFFLVDKLKFDWDSVHAIAEELEHISSEELVNRLAQFLGDPAFDPHGDPIPDKYGSIPVINQKILSTVPLKKSVTVSAVSNQSTQMLEMLKHYHIALGTQLTILKKFEFDGSLEIKVLKQNACIISEQVAKNIFVHDMGKTK